MIGTIKDYSIMPATIHHNSIPTPNMILSVSMLPALTPVLLLVVLWPFEPWLSSFSMNTLPFTRGLCLMFYYCHSSSHYWFPPCSLMQTVSLTDRKNRTTHERPSALPSQSHIYRIYSWLIHSCLLVYMIDSLISAQSRRARRVHRRVLYSFNCSCSSDKSSAMSVSCAVTKKLLTLSQTFPASHCLAKYSHNINLSCISILLRYRREYQYSVALSAIMCQVVFSKNHSVRV